MPADGGALGGFAGADSTCTTLGNTAMPGTSWVAWLSTDAIDAIDRINDTEYRLVNGTEAFTNKQQITTTGRPYWPLVNQHGVPVAGNAWTSTTNYGGGFAGNNCSNWTTNSSLSNGIVGNPSAEPSWSTSDINACNTLNRLICFEQ